MIDLTNKTKFNNNKSKIVNLFKVLHFDEEPILFVGYNNNNEIILGSIIDTDYQQKIDQYFHVIIDIKTIKDFLNKKITYLDILTNAQQLFLIEKSFDELHYETYKITFNNIPEDYLPSNDSFCPDVNLNEFKSFIPTTIFDIIVRNYLLSFHKELKKTNIPQDLTIDYYNVIKLLLKGNEKANVLQGLKQWDNLYSQENYNSINIVNAKIFKKITLVTTEEYLNNYPNSDDNSDKFNNNNDKTDYEYLGMAS